MQWGDEKLVCGNRAARKGSELGTRCGCQGITPLAPWRTDTRAMLPENSKDPVRGMLGMDPVWEGGRGNQGREGQAGSRGGPDAHPVQYRHLGVFSQRACVGLLKVLHFSNYREFQRRIKAKY